MARKQCAPGYTNVPGADYCCQKIDAYGNVATACDPILNYAQVTAIRELPGAFQPPERGCPPGQALDPLTQICVSIPTNDATAQDLQATPAGAPAGSGPLIQPEAPMASGAYSGAMLTALLDKQDPQAGLLGDIISIAAPVIGGIIGGPAGAALGGAVGQAVGGGSTGGQGSSAPPTSSFGGAGDCGPGYIRTALGCVATSPGAYAPGGAPATYPVPGTQVGTASGVAGSFGIPAASPAVFSTVRRQCGHGLVLGRDNLCYPRAALPRQYRKWPSHKPYITRSDYKAIGRADRARKKLIRLTKRAGAFAAMHKPKPTISKSAAARRLAKG